MRIAKVVGNVVLSRSHPSFRGARLRVAIPLTLDELQHNHDPRGESIVVWDEFGAGDGSMIAVSESGEAAQPFRPEMKPVDAYNSAILDQLTMFDAKG